MSKHTPGPWKAIGQWIGTDDDETIAYTDHHRNRKPRPIGEHMANARLIAASPDLLAACERALAFWERYIDRVGPSDSWARAVRDELRAAIARATQGS